MAASYTDDEKSTLLAVARASISHAVAHRRSLPVDPSDYPAPLRKQRAAFVTLHLEKELRGCMGSLQPRVSLVEEVAINAYNAAMRDPRFSPVTEPEITRLMIHISVLTEPQPMTFTDEQDLLRQLVPGTDGLVLEADGHRGTFLPSVWETLPKPEQFLAHLKLKAGLDSQYWSNTMRISRYYAEDIE